MCLLFFSPSTASLPKDYQLKIGNRAGKKCRFADNIGAKPRAPQAVWGARN